MSIDGHNGIGLASASKSEQDDAPGGHRHGKVTEEKKEYVFLKHRLNVAKAKAELQRTQDPTLTSSEDRAPRSTSTEKKSATSSLASFVCGCLYHRKEVEEDREAEFKTIFIGHHPLWYFRYGLLKILNIFCFLKTAYNCFFVYF
jgi:hypothetical protein